MDRIYNNKRMRLTIVSNKNIDFVDRVELSFKSTLAKMGGFFGFLTGFQVLLGGMTTMESVGWIITGICSGAFLHFIFFHLSGTNSNKIVKRLFMPIAIVLIGGFLVVAALVGYQMSIQ